ncbi:MAG: PVC-type heme-binding CxxCH protein [Verrucomicrobiota bacterium]
MRRPLFLLLLTGLSAPAQDLSVIRSSGPLTPAEEQARLKVPAGFKVQLFASEPQINKPMNMAFDGKGRLWVTSSHEYPYAAARDRWADPEGSFVKDSRDGIFILEDTDGDGKADKKTVFADGLNIPMGVLPYKNGCIAWSIPNIWYFEDTNGDSVCDKRAILFGPLGWEKDVHGNCSSFRLAPDGWVYGTHGFSNTSFFQVRPENLKGAKAGDPGTEMKVNSGNVYRFRPDGSRIELFTAGQVNPFGLAFDKHGNLYSADCHSAPIYQLIPGACYPSFGKPDDGLGFAPVMIHHTHSGTGICGITYLDSGVWGPEWADRMFIGNVVTSRVNTDSISFTGTMPRAKEEADFIISDDPWFRPVDLQMGPDGALYVADFYNKIIGHYEVPLTDPGRDKERGRIWRVVKDGVTSRPPAAADKIAEMRFASRSGTLDLPAREAIAARIDSTDPFEKRAAIESLLNPISASWLPRLIKAFEETPADDPALRHQIRIVLRGHLKLPGAISALENLKLSPAATEEMTVVARAVASPEAAAFLFSRLEQQHGDVAGDAASLTRIASLIPADKLGPWVKKTYAGNPAAQADLLLAIVEGVRQRGDLPEASLTAWGSALAAQLLATLPADATPAWANLPYPGSTASQSPWGAQKRPLDGGNGEIMVLSSLSAPGDEPENRTGVLRSKPFAAPAKFSFVLCGHNGPPDKPARGQNYVRLMDVATNTEIVRAEPPRQDAARRLTWDLSGHTGKQVIFEIADGATGSAYAWLGAGGFEPPVITVESFDTTRQTTARLTQLAALLKYAAPIELRDRLAAYLPPASPPPPSPVTPEQLAETNKLIAARTAAFAAAKPDAARGEAVFTVHCANCHSIDGKGAIVGPQLDGIGNRDAARLFEDILDPSRNVDSHFRLHIITKKDNTVFAGLERGEVGQLLICVDAAGKETRLSKSEIATNEETGLSLMPAAFAQSIPEADLNNLVAWLIAHRNAR